MIRLAHYISQNYSGKLVEVGVGNLWDVAVFLAKAGFEVVTTDIKSLSPPTGIRFVVDDITKPDQGIYEDAALVYSIRPPPELFQSIINVSQKVKADCIIKPLHNEFPERSEESRVVNYMGLSFYVWKRLEKYDEDNQR